MELPPEGICDGGGITPPDLGLPPPPVDVGVGMWCRARVPTFGVLSDQPHKSAARQKGGGGEDPLL